MARDRSVIDMEDYFLQKKFADVTDASNLSAILTENEIKLIAEEIARCRNSFEHAAKNWFWVTSKSSVRVLFDLWDGQRLVLEKLDDMRRRGKSPATVVIKSRQLGLSQLGCALAAHKCIFHSGQKALIMSEDENKTKLLWNQYILPIYQDLPWFLKPQASSLSIEKGMILDSDAKRSNSPGLRSTINISPASTTG